MSVKLGTITAEGDAGELISIVRVDSRLRSIDIYCYKCNDAKQDPDLKAHLASFGINVGSLTKTEKSMTELVRTPSVQGSFLSLQLKLIPSHSKSSKTFDMTSRSSLKTARRSNLSSVPASQAWPTSGTHATWPASSRPSLPSLPSNPATHINMQNRATRPSPQSALNASSLRSLMGC